MKAVAPLVQSYAKAQTLVKCFQQLSIRTCATDKQRQVTTTKGDTTHGKVLRISKAMQSYLQNAEAHEKMLEEHREEFELGRRYLAKMMDADPENFTQEDIDEAISYLLPSGLFSKKARPMMKPPSEIFPPRKAAEFDASGRPHHTMFYTGLPNYYETLHSVATKIESFAQRDLPADRLHAEDPSDFLAGSEWVSQDILTSMLMEKITDANYEQFVVLMSKLAEHSKAILEKEFLMKFRQPLAKGEGLVTLPEEFKVDPETGVRSATAEGKRKHSVAVVTVKERGTGKFCINGRGLDEFPELHQREQLMSPLTFVNKLGRVDVEGTITGEGDKVRAGAVRHALSLALAKFEDEDMQEQMRQAGLLTRDPRRRERDKPGQKGARAKKTWKKR